tara:strand:- start:422 stop:856 length:435 start_codon:yes stop_codon:yes gene_type:complete
MLKKSGMAKNKNRGPVKKGGPLLDYKKIAGMGGNKAKPKTSSGRPKKSNPFAKSKPNNKSTRLVDKEAPKKPTVKKTKPVAKTKPNRPRRGGFTSRTGPSSLDMSQTRTRSGPGRFAGGGKTSKYRMKGGGKTSKYMARGGRAK